jgi:hypothetical protein
MNQDEAGSNHLPITRRHVLQLMAATAGLAVYPRLLARAGTPSAAGGLSARGFLTADELVTLDAATAAILPTDALPGARDIGVVDYIQSLLSFMPGTDANCDRLVTAADVTAVVATAHGHAPHCADAGDVNGDGTVDYADVRAAEAAPFEARPMFGGGPFSGRNPQFHFPVGTTPCAQCHGAHPSSVPASGAAAAETVAVYPPNAFAQFTPLNRLQRLSWQLRILGPAAVPAAASNPLLAELPEVDLRRRYREGLAALDAHSQERYGKPFAALTPAQQQVVFRDSDQPFVDLLHRHVIQGTLCAPEYGGNRDRMGWALVGFDGDSQPLGYEIYDPAAPGFYRERPDKPNRGPNPDEDCRGFSAEMKRFLSVISRGAGGGQFANPYCFGVDG